MIAAFFAERSTLLHDEPNVQVGDTTKMLHSTAAGFPQKTAFIFLFLFFHLIVGAQKEIVPGWHLLDARKDGYHGISLAEAKKLLQGRTGKPVVVAVMDGGIDTNHPSLRPVLWTNPKEIAENGKDDDGNGYVDDVHGWNFLGNAKGENINKESQEAVRIYHRFKSQFLNKPFDSTHADAQTKANYILWKRSSELLDVKPEEKQALGVIQLFIKLSLSRLAFINN